MSKDLDEALELTPEDNAKKARKAELKAAEKAKKQAKESKKAQRKIEKQQRKAAALDVKSASEDQKSPGESVVAVNNVSQSMSLGAKLQAVARLARSNLAASLLKHGLYAGQEQVLFMLHEHGPLALAELAEKLDVRAPTITKTVTRMEAQSFLARAVSRDDARSIIIALTPEGRRVMEIGRQIAKDTEAVIFSSLTNADHESLIKTLDRVLLNIKSR